MVTMEEDRFEELRAQAADLRVRAIEGNQALIAELQQVWRGLNQLASGSAEVRRVRDQVAADIARLEKIDLAFDAEWLADVRRDQP